MDYSEYIAYHRRGDAAVEERMIASLAKYFNLSQWDTFKLIYFYSMTYHIPSALRLLFKPTTTQKKRHRVPYGQTFCGLPRSFL